MMKKNSFIFSSNSIKFVYGIIFGCIIFYTLSLFINYTIKKSDFRFSQIFSDKQLDNYDTFVLGNSRSVSFNKFTLDDNSIFNLSYNSINYNELLNILDALKNKTKNKPVIYIELTSLIYDNIECRFTIFTHLENFIDRKILEKNCKTQFFLEKFFPITKVKNEIFLRTFYYSIFKNRDQKWHNNYIMPEKTCSLGKLSPFARMIIKSENQNKMLLNAKKILKENPNQRIKFFITPIFSKKKNYGLIIENYVKKNLKDINFLEINENLPETFYKDCEMFADSLHLSLKGVKSVNFYTKFIGYH